MRQRSLVPIVAGGSLFLGAIFYSTRSGPSTSHEKHTRAGAEAKKAEGMSGAGVGGNFNTGGHELSGKTDRKPEPTDVPKEKLPSGGVGGGVGAGGSNARNIDLHGHKAGGTSSANGPSGMLQGFLGTGGASAGNTDPETKNTKVASNYDRTPTKRGNNTNEHDVRQPRTPRPDTPGGHDHKDVGTNI